MARREGRSRARAPRLGLAVGLILAGLATVPVTGPAARADHCTGGSISISDLFDEDSHCREDDTTTTTTTTQPGVATTTSVAEDGGSDATELLAEDDLIDVGAAILDALDPRLAEQLVESEALLDAVGCEVLHADRCPRTHEALRAASDLVLAVLGTRSGEQAGRAAQALATVAITGALRDTDGRLLFPTVVASMPVLAQLARAAALGGEAELETLTTFGNIVLALDARAGGLIE